MAVGLAVRQRGAAVRHVQQQAQPWAGLRTVWVRVGLHMGLHTGAAPAMRAPRTVERTGDDATAWADTQPAMFWNALHTPPDEA